MDQQVYAMKIADIFNAEVRKIIFTSVNKKLKSVFPSPDSLYSKDIVKKQDIIHNNIVNFQINNHIQANQISNVSIGLALSNPTSTVINNSSTIINNNFPNTKKKYFEEDSNNVIGCGSSNGKNGFPSKNKKAVGKLQYREKIISSSIINSNNLITNKTENEKSDNENCIEIEKSKLNGLKGSHVLSNQIMNEADMNSNETTSTSSKDDNFNANNKQGENLLNKKDDKKFGELIEIMKFDSGKLSSFNNLTTADNLSCKDINRSNYSSGNSGLFKRIGLKSYSGNDKNLFSLRNFSRFDFANGIINKANNHKSNKNIREEKTGENVEIPEFVLELIQKKISRQMFTKKFEFMEDILYRDDSLQKEHKNENHWAEFILENKNIDTDKEFTFDFEIINKSLRDKFKTYYLK